MKIRHWYFTSVVTFISCADNVGMNDIHALSLTIDFQNMLVSKDEFWLPVHDIQNSLVGHKVIVRKTTVIPRKSQRILSAYVEGTDDKFVFCIECTILNVLLIYATLCFGDST